MEGNAHARVLRERSLDLSGGLREIAVSSRDQRPAPSSLREHVRSVEHLRARLERLERG
jgi:hypothetical protein